MQRYFIDSNYNDVIFNDEQTRHIQKVMRMGVGDLIEVVFKEKGFIYKITSIQPLQVECVEELPSSPELNVNITLLYCLPKGDKLDLVIQKATEIGAKEIVLVQSSRCVSKFSQDDFKRKQVRFQKIALEASEQSHRLVVPKIEKLINYKDIKNLKYDYAYIAYENERNVSFKEDLKDVKPGATIGIIIGSEGGFSQEEVDYAMENGYRSITLGKRILRSETACIYSLSVLSYLLEDVK